MKRSFFIVSLALAAVVSTAPSIAGNAGLRPPAGWAEKTVGSYSGYVAPHTIGGFTPNIVINSEAASIDDEVAAFKTEIQNAGMHYVSERDIPCKVGYRGHFVEFTHVQLGFNIDVLQLQIGRLDEKNTTFFTYSRPVGTPVDPSALASTKSPCT